MHDAVTWLAGSLFALVVCVGSAETVAGQSKEPVTSDNVVGVILRDVHPLHGGQNLYLSRDGSGYCQVVSRHPDSRTFFERRYKAALPADRMRALVRLLVDASPDTIPSSIKPGLPDSARPTIIVRLSSERVLRISRWERDRHPDFYAIYQTLLSEAKSAATGAQDLVGPYDPRCVPEGFAWYEAGR